MNSDPESALAALPPAYHRLYRRVVEVAEADHRIRGLWLSGSLARGTADAGSDLDLVLAIADDCFAEFLAGWRDWLGGIAPILVAEEIPRTELIFYALTKDLCRIDGVLEPVERLSRSPHRTRIPVIDRDGLDRLVAEPEPGSGPDPDLITGMITEFWRQQAIFPAMLDGRRDLLVALAGVHTAGQLLYDVFVESNQPLPPMGVKHFRSRLTREQYRILQELPAVSADRLLLIIADTAVRRAMQTAGRAAAERVGAQYPDELAQTVDGFVSRVLQP